LIDMNVLLLFGVSLVVRLRDRSDSMREDPT
jgi:hypothetical protein